MLRKLFRLILGVAAGTALAYYATSDRGRALYVGARDRMQAAGLDISRLGTTAGGPAREETQEAIEAKIEETRRRLRDQMDKIAESPSE